MLFVAYLEQGLSPIQNLTELYTSLRSIPVGPQALAAAARRSARGGRGPAGVRAAGRRAIEFEDVVFGYTRRRCALDGVSFRIRAGERVGLVGPSGAGKTTITDLLAGLYQPESGAIRIDGQRLDEVAPSSVRATVRSVAADGTLFRMTVAENIRYAHPDASDAEVAEAARLAGLEPLLLRLPEGLATPIGERGVELSVGERQRVLLARAFVARPVVLLLDEATANLDFKTEEAVKQALDTISPGTHHGGGRASAQHAHRRGPRAGPARRPDRAGRDPGGTARDRGLQADDDGPGRRGSLILSRGLGRADALAEVEKLPALRPDRLPLVAQLSVARPPRGRSRSARPCGRACADRCPGPPRRGCGCP